MNAVADQANWVHLTTVELPAAANALRKRFLDEWLAATKSEWRNSAADAKAFKARHPQAKLTDAFECGDVCRFDEPILCTLLLCLAPSGRVASACHDVRRVRNKLMHNADRIVTSGDRGDFEKLLRCAVNALAVIAARPKPKAEKKPNAPKPKPAKPAKTKEQAKQADRENVRKRQQEQEKRQKQQQQQHQEAMQRPLHLEAVAKRRHQEAMQRQQQEAMQGQQQEATRREQRLLWHEQELGLSRAHALSPRIVRERQPRTCHLNGYVAILLVTIPGVVFVLALALAAVGRLWTSECYDVTSLGAIARKLFGEPPICATLRHLHKTYPPVIDLSVAVFEALN
jgi:hypothetical protein